jgi:hypothetical protein
MSNDIGKAVASESNNGRQAMGSIAPMGAPYGPGSGTAVPKVGNAKGGSLDPSAGTKQNRKGVLNAAGAAYKIKQTFPAQTPQAQATQANGRIIPASHRAGKGFWSQAAGL